MIKLSYSMTNYYNKDYKGIEAILRNSGFTNIQTIDMHDLTTSLLKKPGMIENVTIDGEKPQTGKWYDPSSSIVITYHGYFER